MKRISMFLLCILILASGTISAHAQEPTMQLYDMSIEQEKNVDSEALSYIKNEIAKQFTDIANINGIDTASANSVNLTDSINLSDSIKVVFINDNIIEQISSAKDVMVRKNYVANEDVFNSRFLDYYWKVPVMEYDWGYLYSTVIMNSSTDIVVSSTIVPEKELSDVSYLFDKSIIPNIFKESGLNIEYDTVVPLSIPIISTDIIIFMADKVQYAIPFSSRSDLLGVENGKIYKYEELESIVSVKPAST